MTSVKRSALWLVAVAVLFAATVASAEWMGPAMKGTTALGDVLQTQAGMTLYTFAKDSAGKSVCNGPCATNWPPFTATADAKAEGDWSIVTRDDGSKQWAYKGMPLYAFFKDKAPGDTLGEGLLNGAWLVAKP